MTEPGGKFEAFMQRVMQRPLPSNPLARIRTLAKELAEGVNEEIWNGRLVIGVDEKIENNKRVPVYNPEVEYEDYLSRRWDDNYPNPKVLQLNGYLDQQFTLTETAFALVDEIEPAEIFISYRRKDSSAFALLVLARLKEHDLNTFLDMSLQPGDNWHANIKEQIQQRDFFILLVGKETLNSSVVKEEILWAIEAKTEIIPIWHNGFEYKEDEFDLRRRFKKSCTAITASVFLKKALWLTTLLSPNSSTALASRPEI